MSNLRVFFENICLASLAKMFSTAPNFKYQPTLLEWGLVPLVCIRACVRIITFWSTDSNPCEKHGSMSRFGCRFRNGESMTDHYHFEIANGDMQTFLDQSYILPV